MYLFADSLDYYYAPQTGQSQGKDKLSIMSVCTCMYAYVCVCPH